MLPSQSCMETRRNCFGPQKNNKCQGNWRSEKISKTVFNPNTLDCFCFAFEKKTHILFADFAQQLSFFMWTFKGRHIQFHSGKRQIYLVPFLHFHAKCKSQKISQSLSVLKSPQFFSIFFHKEVLKGLLFIPGTFNTKGNFKFKDFGHSSLWHLLGIRTAWDKLDGEDEKEDLVMTSNCHVPRMHKNEP